MGSFMSSSVKSGQQECQKFIEETIDSHHLVIFSKTSCPYCSKVKTLFRKLNVMPYIVEINERSDMALCQQILGNMTGRTTVPRVFIDRKSIGGCDDVYALHAKNKLKPLLKISETQ